MNMRIGYFVFVIYVLIDHYYCLEEDILKQILADFPNIKSMLTPPKFCKNEEGIDFLQCTFHDECDAEYCNNHGICLLYRFHDLNPRKTPAALCICNAGWTGVSCRADEKECSLFGPCTTDQKCAEISGTYMCLCPLGYSGILCHVPRKFDCKLTPCENNGICQHIVDRTYCQCPKDWTGLACNETVSKELTGKTVDSVCNVGSLRSKGKKVVHTLFTFLLIITVLSLLVGALIYLVLKFKKLTSPFGWFRSQPEMMPLVETTTEGTQMPPARMIDSWKFWKRGK